jgi:hypothetical protein
MHLDRTWKPKLDGDFKDITSTDNRRLLMDTTGIAKSNLVNYFADFYKKNILLKNANGGAEVNPFFMEEPENGVLEINLILNCYEQSEE